MRRIPPRSVLIAVVSASLVVAAACETDTSQPMAPSESVLSELPPPSTLNEPRLGRGAPLQPETDRLVVYAESHADLQATLGRTELTPVGIEPVPGQLNHWFVITQGADPEGLDARVSSQRAEPVVDSGCVATRGRAPRFDDCPLRVVLLLVLQNHPHRPLHWYLLRAPVSGQFT